MPFDWNNLNDMPWLTDFPSVGESLARGAQAGAPIAQSRANFARLEAEQRQFERTMPLRIQQAQSQFQLEELARANAMLDMQLKVDAASDRTTMTAAQAAWMKGDTSVAPPLKTPQAQGAWENWKADTALGKKIADENALFKTKVAGLDGPGIDSVLKMRGNSPLPSAEAWAKLGEEQKRMQGATIKTEQDMETFKQGLKNPPNMTGLNEEQRNTAMDLFQKLNSEPAIKQFTSALASHESMKNQVVSSRKDPTGANDISIIFSYMKSIDPQSTVREGEFATAQQSGGIPQNIVAQYNKILQGERLTQEQRENFLKTSERSLDAYEKSANSVRGRYIKQGSNFGIGENFFSDSPYAFTRDTPSNQFKTEDEARKSGAKSGDIIEIYDPAKAQYRKARLK